MSLILLAAALAAHDLPDDLRQLGRSWEQPNPTAAVAAELRGRIQQANDRESRAWQALDGKASWEKYREARLAALRESLGAYPAPPRDLKLKVRRTLEARGYRIDNLTFESRPGLLVTANLYRPDPLPKSAPGVIIVHSHHAPKTEGELQDMGALWARKGCYVLVLDQLGHGERRAHPFLTAKDHAKTFRPGRQDYYFRYNTSLQLYAVGDSLMGWMVYDLARGVDVLLSRPGIDPKRLLILGAVAGGGDPAAAAAALDTRLTAAAIFNFGGPQPETRYPLPADAEASFNYAGGGSWESTRNLFRSAKDGFLPWVIVGAVAPRRHVYGHEFAWDRPRDPVWQRLRRIRTWHGDDGGLAFSFGAGAVTGRGKEDTHCNNIGAVHRKSIHEGLAKWFDLPAGAEPPRDRRPAAELLCLDKDERPRPLHELAAEVGDARAAAFRRTLAGLAPAQQRQRLRQAWDRLLGDTAPPEGRALRAPLAAPPAGVEAEWVGSASTAWALLLRPKAARGRVPIVLALGQGGPQAFLAHRAAEIAALLKDGSAVALAELGGMSNLPPGANRGRTSASTSLSATSLMLGRPMLADRLREARALVRHLRARNDVDDSRLSLWGDSFAPVNRPGPALRVPLDVAQPPQAEPLGGVLALLVALYEDGVAEVRAAGGLVSYRSLLDGPFLHVPHDIVVPGVLTAGDLPDVVAALAPRPVRLMRLVDATNCPVSAAALEKQYAAARAAYRASGRLRVEAGGW